ncbi:DUF4124 domain-containing protein [Acidihalobacter prosperus]|uniref:DUF4124 domain-containing protein n=1 Tax=Acidihalobacter prosperus TaxID=160660 RepID=A0A1A6C173_9GAMM|nr:DUF4124 domain-containing protein [Acidihalobacter prosperus]OBS08298.1 hypothetical protein Thpro_022548 [Acidihalobacter prosperus]
MSVRPAVDHGFVRRRRLILLVTLLALVVWQAFSVLSAQAAIYRWRDAKGTVHYDQSLPDAAVARGYEVLDAGGEVIRRVPPPPTAEQRAHDEAEARAAAQAEAKEEARERHDQMLLQTFSSVGDIRHMRDERLRALDVQIQLARDRVAQQAGGDAAARAAARSTLQDLLHQREQIKLEFEADVRRFRQLKRLPSP